MEWYSVEDEAAQERLVGAWNDAPVENLEVLSMLMEVAKEQVLAHAPAIVPEVTVVDGIVQSIIVIPARYVLAQRAVAIKIWDSNRSSEGGAVGEEPFAFVASPAMQKWIRAIVRPADGKPDAY